MLFSRTPRVMLVLLLLMVQSALAHAGLEASTPANGTVVNAPQEIVLTFIEPIETMFSVFELHQLDVAPDADHELHAQAAHDAMTHAFNMDATSLRASEMLTSGQSATVTLALPTLAPGSYTLMWRVLSIDSHPSQDFITFVVSDAPASTSN
jgi:methionine-rich copper-binding protein CopC